MSTAIFVYADGTTDSVAGSSHELWCVYGGRHLRRIDIMPDEVDRKSDDPPIYVERSRTMFVAERDLLEHRTDVGTIRVEPKQSRRFWAKFSKRRTRLLGMTERMRMLVAMYEVPVQSAIRKNVRDT